MKTKMRIAWRSVEAPAMSRSAGLLVLALGMGLCGCASVTTKITGSARAGTEQLLLTGISDRAVGSIDFRPLAGRRVFLDTTQVKAADDGWVIFSLRREMARQGVLLVGDKKDAQVLVEAAVAAYGTDEVDCRFSLPNSFSAGVLPLPTGTSDAGGLIRKNRQDVAVKLALFGYDAKSQQLVWESDDVTQFGYLDRRYIGTSNLTRRSSEPELEEYPPRRVK
jgi:hypothetical protein